jgi:acyl carrier protein
MAAPKSSHDADPSQAATERLCAILQELTAELHPHLRGRSVVSLDSHLVRDLGIDSLGRMELLARLEQAFGVSIPEQALFTTETVREVLTVVLAAAPAGPVTAAREPPPAAAAALEAPTHATTLTAVLDWYAEHTPERAHIYLHTGNGLEEMITYRSLRTQAGAIAAGLGAQGLVPGTPVAIMLPTGREYFFSFFGVLLAGGVPVPIYPPMGRAQLAEHVVRHARILANAETPILITVAEAKPLAQWLRAHAPGLRAITTVAELAASESAGTPAPRQGSDLALLQYTSGSTGNPKGVMLTHADLLANIRVMGDVTQTSSRDLFVSWMPLYHDMGLIGAWLGSLYFGMPLAVMSPLTFLAHPERWLWTIHRHRATLSGAPNFGYELCLKRVHDARLEGLDLSSWRMAFNGAEPVSPDTLERFHARFARYGLKREALAPVYGLAECALGLAFPPPNRGPLVDRIQREEFMRTGQAIPAEPGDGNALRFVACGRPLPGYGIRIVDETGRELGEREEGRLEFSGPSATRGYYRNPKETAKLIRDGWLDSGDLAYLADGDVYITGRVKDVIIRAGRNIYPHELEEAIGNIGGIRKGCIAVFGARDRRNGTERLVIVAETYSTDSDTLARLRGEIQALSMQLTGTPPDDIVLAAPHTVLKTSSGKIRRSASRALYESGELGRPTAQWRQWLPLAARSTGLALRRLHRSATELLYAAYAWCAFVILGLPTWLVVMILPGPRWCLPLIRRAARLAAALCLIRLRVRGLEHLPSGPCVIAANHASYIDGIVLTALLPGAYSFIAKREFTRQFVVGRFLRNIGAVFVERFDPHKSLADARALGAAARAGQRLVYFPEGTFTEAPGLLPFRMGAFVAAAEARVPVVPVALRGTRAILRGERWFPRRGNVEMVVSEPLLPGADGWNEALRLRDAARAAILRDCGEPDLAYTPRTL